jgi:thiamine-phosphate pyrophosphorylase
MTKLYLISPPQIKLHDFKKNLKTALGAGEIGAFQLRLKNTDISEIKKAVAELLPICHEYGAPFFINDHFELAREFKVDGIHIGQEDGNLKAIREEFGKDMIIGVSCQNSKHSAMVAAENGADYVSFGAFYETKTKEGVAKADLDILSWWLEYTKIPCSAIGGINIKNISEVAKYQPDFICVISAIWNNPEKIENAVKELVKCL